MTHTSNLVQNFLKENILWHYIKKDQWSPKSPGSYPLDYYFWNKVTAKAYEDRLNTSFESEEMISKIKVVLGGMRFKPGWNSKIFERNYQQTPFSQGINESSIKMHFGQHFATLSCHSFHNTNNLQFPISLNMFYSLDFLFFSRTIFLTSFSFFINMLKLCVVKLVLILDFFCKIKKLN